VIEYVRPFVQKVEDTCVPPTRKCVKGAVEKWAYSDQIGSDDDVRTSSFLSNIGDGYVLDGDDVVDLRLFQQPCWRRFPDGVAG
jgi:hypothetical protein